MLELKYLRQELMQEAEALSLQVAKLPKETSEDVIEALVIVQEETTLRNVIDKIDARLKAMALSLEIREILE